MSGAPRAAAPKITSWLPTIAAALGAARLPGGERLDQVSLTVMNRAWIITRPMRPDLESRLRDPASRAGRDRAEACRRIDLVINRYFDRIDETTAMRIVLCQVPSLGQDACKDPGQDTATMSSATPCPGNASAARSDVEAAHQPVACRGTA